MIHVTGNIVLADEEVHELFIRSSGPGGQNVNKVATGVQVRFDVAHSPSLPEDVRRRLMTLAGSRLTKEGMLVIGATRFRTQDRNREDARERLIALIRQAAQPPKRRHRTRPSLASQVRRLEGKRRRGERKRCRRPVADE